MENGYPIKEYKQRVKRYCQTLELRDQPELIAEYRNIHSNGHAWPEIIAGIKEVGILEMELYIHGSRLIMIVETPIDFNWDEAMDRLAKLPRQQEWEDYVGFFQKVEPGGTSSQKWQQMERIFYLYD